MQVEPDDPSLPKIGVVGLHRDAPEETDRRSIERILEVIHGSNRAQAIGPDALSEALGGRRELARTDGLLGPGRQLLAEGRTLYQQARPEDAVMTLERAVASLRAGMAGANQVQELWEAWLYLGTSLLTLDRISPGRFALREAVALDPDRTPDPSRFPPQVQQAWKEVRLEAQGQAVSLQIHAPPDAAIHHNGRPLGTGPMIVPALPGEHFIIAWSPSGHAYQRLRVIAGQGASVTLEPGPPSLGQPATDPPGRSTQIHALYRALGAHTPDLELLLLAGTEGDGVSVQLYDLSTDTFSRAIQREETDDEALSWSISGLLGMVEADGSLNSISPSALPLDLGANPTLSRLLLAAPPAPTPPPERKKGISGRAVLGVVAAGILVGAGTGLAVHLTRSPPPHGGTLIVGPF